MEKKINIRSALFIAGAVSVITFAATSFWAFEVCNDSVAIYREKSRSIEDIFEVDKYIDENYYGEYDEKEVVDTSLKAMVGALDDKYSVYMSSDEYEQDIINAKGAVSGIGITVNLVDEKDITVVELSDGPAKEAGVKVDDILIAVDGKDVTQMEYRDAVKLVRGDVGTKVTLTFKRGDEKLDFTMIREEIASQTVTSRMLEDNIGYIRISSFKETTSSQYEEALKECLDNNAKAIIFDVRNNGGGLVSACNSCIDPLLPKGDIAIAEFKDGSTEVICSSDAEELNIPMAVIINEKSASAAELFAASLKDFDKAVLVGKNSFGKGIMQNTFNLSNGGGVRLTVAKYRTTKSDCYHGVGLAPEYEVDNDDKYKDTEIEKIPEEYDLQLKKAIEVLKETK